MPEVAYLSSTGEIKIPLRVRIQMGLRDGEKFSVTPRGQNLLLRRMGLPSAEQVREFIALRRSEKKSQKAPRVKAPKRPAKRAALRRPERKP